MKKVYLKETTDLQNLLIMKLSYLDFDIEKYEKLREEGKEITINNIEEILVNPYASYLGIDELKEKEILGKTKIPTQLEVIQMMKECDLESLKINDIACDPEVDFKAIAFEDGYGNIGISYCGIDFGKVLENEDSNILDLMKVSDEQVEDSEIFFRNNKDETVRNYIYGHSLGGTLASHVYLNNYKNIDRAHLINSIPINPELLDTNDKIIAFGDQEKYNYDIIGGDELYKMLEPYCKKYKQNVMFAISERNNNLILQPNIFRYHFIESLKLISSNLELGNLVGKIDDTTNEYTQLVYALEEVAYRDRECGFELEEKEELDETINLVDGITKFGKNIWKTIKKIFDRGKRLLPSDSSITEESKKTDKSIRERYKVQTTQKTVAQNDKKNEILKNTRGEDEGR